MNGRTAILATAIVAVLGQLAGSISRTARRWRNRTRRRARSFPSFYSGTPARVLRSASICCIPRRLYMSVSWLPLRRPNRLRASRRCVAIFRSAYRF